MSTSELERVRWRVEAKVAGCIVTSTCFSISLSFSFRNRVISLSGTMLVS